MYCPKRYNYGANIPTRKSTRLSPTIHCTATVTATLFRLKLSSWRTGRSLSCNHTVHVTTVLKLHATHIQQSALVSSVMGLWGTCPLDDLELAHVHQSVNFYLCITPVGSGRLLVNTAQFSVPATDHTVTR